MQLFSMTYNTIQPIENIIIKEKKSKFIGFAYPIESETEVKERIKIIKKEHPKATHHCYAYKLGLDENNFRANDDGEPTGTAGKPILNQINSFNITNCLVIIVRYFGGTKLGVSGLIDAYKNCAKETLSSTEIIVREIRNVIYFEADFELSNLIFDFLNKHKIEYQKEFTEIKVAFSVYSSDEQTAVLLEFLNKNAVIYQPISTFRKY